MAQNAFVDFIYIFIYDAGNVSLKPTASSYSSNANKSSLSAAASVSARLALLSARDKASFRRARVGAAAAPEAAGRP